MTNHNHNHNSTLQAPTKGAGLWCRGCGKVFRARCRARRDGLCGNCALYLERSSPREQAKRRAEQQAERLAGRNERRPQQAMSAHGYLIATLALTPTEEEAERLRRVAIYQHQLATTGRIDYGACGEPQAPAASSKYGKPLIRWDDGEEGDGEGDSSGAGKRDLADAA